MLKTCPYCNSILQYKQIYQRDLVLIVEYCPQCYFVNSVDFICVCGYRDEVSMLFVLEGRCPRCLHKFDFAQHELKSFIDDVILNFKKYVRI